MILYQIQALGPRKIYVVFVTTSRVEKNCPSTVMSGFHPFQTKLSPILFLMEILDQQMKAKKSIFHTLLPIWIDVHFP